ncbi:hypothetical protein PROFUN_05358 [Planoprotostelium fungivorum]|uniref:BIG2 domain-containing protein n=1 Tax=Planoprotostelium fungivorum TaxID=1890364 RepID=A0A2P6NR53_9EUKA|nr:hypothetical protein PROFUN_05358 [Planoprotostelium fungivorum]
MGRPLITYTDTQTNMFELGRGLRCLFLLLICVHASLGIEQHTSYKVSKQFCQTGTTLSEKAEKFNGLGTEASISDLTLLLPHSVKPNSNRVQYIVRADNGCFKWTSKNSDVVTVEPLEDNIDGECCSKSAIVTAVTSGDKFTRTATWILAEETTTGKILRCEVFVDWIESIEIQTTTRTISKDDVELLEIQAVDSQGNVFSSVMGLRFEWTIGVPENVSNSQVQVLSVVDFKDVNLDGPAILSEMEKKGMRTSAVLVRGIEFGKAVVNSQLVETGHEVDTARVHLSVLDPLQIEPPSVYMVNGAKINYQLQIFTKDRIANISLPSVQYKWSSSDVDVAHVKNNGELVSKSLGQAEILVNHADMHENEAKAQVHVVPPSYLTLTIKWDNGGQVSTVLVRGWEYTCTVSVHYVDGHVMYIPALHRFTNDLGDKLKLEKELENGKKFHFTPTSRGQATIKSSTVFDPQVKAIDNQLRVAKDFIVTDPVEISPRNVNLPYVNGGRHEYKLNVKGGTDPLNMRWKTSDPSVVTVNSNGIVTVVGEGRATVTASDSKNPANQDSVTVSCTPPDRLELSTLYGVETQKDRHNVVTLTLLDAQGNKFDNCSTFPVQWKFEPRGVFTPSATAYNATDRPEACVFYPLLALKEGRTVLTATSESAGLSSSITLYSYAPLRVVHPTTARALVTLGSTATFVLAGGPDPWEIDPAAYNNIVEPEHPHSVAIETTPVVRTSDVNVQSFSVACKSYGHQKIHVTVGNSPTIDHPKPSSSSVTVEFECKEPSRVEVVLGGEKKENSCTVDALFPLTTSQQEKNTNQRKYLVKNNRKVPFTVNVYDLEGRQFDNRSSLAIQWQSADPQIARFEEGEDSGSWISMGNNEGTVSLEVWTRNYKKDALKRYHIAYPKDHTDPRLTAQLVLLLTHGLQLEPTRATLYRHPQNRLEYTVQGGSGQYNVEVNDTSLARIERATADVRSFKLIPLGVGDVHLTISDKCMHESELAHSDVTISDAASIDVNSRRLIQLEQYSPVQYQILDRNGQPFSEDQIRHVEVKVISDSPVLSVDRDAAGHRVRGSQLGMGRLHAQLLNDEGQPLLQSRPLEVQVYPAFNLSPKKIVLLEGSRTLLESSGGPPQASRDVQYVSRDPKIASVDGKGVITAHAIGTTTVQGTIHSNGHSLGEDTVQVTVQELTGISIETATHQLLVERDMHVRLVGHGGVSTSALALLPCGISWSTSSRDIATITHGEKNSFEINVKGKSYGRTRLSVSLDCPKNRRLHGMKADAEMKVKDELKIEGGDVLLLNHGATKKIRTNRDGSRDLRYDVMGDCNNRTACIRLSEEGQVEAGDKTCSTSVLVEEGGEGKVIRVEVKPVHYVHFRQPLSTEIPLGGKLLLPVDFKDNFGNTFDAVEDRSIGVQVMDDESMVAQMTERGVEVRGHRPGSSLLRVYVREVEDMEDFIQLRVGNSIFPRDPVVHVGSQIAFKSTTLDKGESVGTWSSDDKTKLIVSSDKGVANAIATGTADVRLSSQSDSHSRVSISEVDAVVVDRNNVTFVHNGFGPDGKNVKFLVGIELLGSDGRAFTFSPYIDHRVQITCHVNAGEWIKVTSERDPTTGRYHCRLVPQVPSLPTTAPPTHVALLVEASHGSRTVTAVPEDIRFDAQLSLHPQANLTLTPGVATILHVREEVDSITSTDDNKLSIKSVGSNIVPRGLSHPRVIKYEIRPTGYSSLDGVKLLLHSRGEVQELPVHLVAPTTQIPREAPAGWSSLATWLWTTLLGLSVLLVLAYFSKAFDRLLNPSPPPTPSSHPFYTSPPRQGPTPGFQPDFRSPKQPEYRSPPGAPFGGASTTNHSIGGLNQLTPPRKMGGNNTPGLNSSYTQ